MTNLRSLKPKELLSILEKAGWKIIRQKGSHIQLKHSNKPGFRVTIPYHNKDLAHGTINSIIKQIGLTRKEFIEILD
ncbi:MAG: type II toxin-antitoxin system HicA family toxin [Candidatus Melainabacteria bacterium]|nr:type II toxin-antitoxin system HicA family toxin [Candidatus Melainabacteria bacterium]